MAGLHSQTSQSFCEECKLAARRLRTFGVMVMAISLEQFQSQIAASELLKQEEVSAFISAFPEDKRPKSAEELARELVRQKRLTKYQAEQIYAGKGKMLVLGNYVVLDKLGQGGMGVVLKAEHKRLK